MNRPQLSLDIRFQIHMLNPSESRYNNFRGLSNIIKDINKRYTRTRELIDLQMYQEKEHLNMMLYQDLPRIERDIRRNN